MSASATSFALVSADVQVSQAPAARSWLPRHPWLAFAGAVLLGYALIGKGAAYVGVPPIFLGEMLLAAGLASVLCFGRLRGTPLPVHFWILGALAAWGVYRTIPYLSVYGIEAIRDTVIWGYGTFAFIWFVYVVTKPRRLPAAMNYYARFALIAVYGMPFFWLARYVMGDATPLLPLSDQPVIELRAGDILVHLAGILAFWVSRERANVGWPTLIVFLLCLGIMSAYERAGMFAFLAIFCICAYVRRNHPIIRRLVLLVAAGLAILAFTGIRFNVPTIETTKEREISFQQFAGNVVSAIFPSDMGDMENTKEWRLEWWHEIINYTIHGPYRWTGKGFGVNLADDDGFQVTKNHALRSPHNGHLMILARAGLPGLGLWVLLQLAWAGTVWRTLVRSLRADDGWTGVFLFLFCYWLAFVINASFDVYLEGPMGGIWFWTIFGLGLAAVWARKHHPDLLRQYANPYRP